MTMLMMMIKRSLAYLSLLLFIVVGGSQAKLGDRYKVSDISYTSQGNIITVKALHGNGNGDGNVM